ncbi:MAG TPA: shikimate dehydrogenase [Bacillales bacterium]|nr:shikimate dehydrogenase [Bacillales bacterium]
MGKLYALIGHPIGHSLSPQMHNDCFQMLNIPAHYESFDVAPTDLEKAIEGMKALGVAGFNVTIPHKVAVMSYLDDVDEEANRIGAVNTVINRNGRLYGTNTDGKGYLQSLIEKAGEDLSNKRVLIIGAGGAARGVAVSLDRHGVNQLDVANRTLEKAEKLIETGIHATSFAQPLTLEEASENLGHYEIVVHTTPIGMFPKTDDMPMPLDRLKPGTVLSELIYNPLQTKWLQEGERKGAIIVDGVGMFVGQGALAFELWTGRQPDRDRMRQTVLKQLGRES